MNRGGLLRVLGVLGVGGLLFGGCLPSWRAFVRNVPSPKDVSLFSATEVPSSPHPSALPVASLDQIPPLSQWVFGKYGSPSEKSDSLNPGHPEHFFRKTGTTAFLIFQNDSLRFEWYSPQNDAASPLPSFSLVKPYIALLAGIALSEGTLTSLDNPVYQYLPEFKSAPLDQITLRHLLQMNSGLRSREGYLNPWGGGARLYYGAHLERELRRIRVARPPGEAFEYKNLNTQILVWVLEKATQMPIQSYFSKKLWAPLGMEAPATWSLDREGGNVKGFCCLNAHARDHIRMGRMLLNNGTWAGKEIVPKEWLELATDAYDTLGGSPAGYQYGWYLSGWEQDYFGQGLLGQYLYVCPAKNLVIVRFGRGLKYKVPWYDMFRYLSGLESVPRFHPNSRADRDFLEGAYKFGLSTRGDSTMLGKSAFIRAHGKGLQIKTETHGRFLIYPESKWQYFQGKEAMRRLEFIGDSSGSVREIRWIRSGYEWKLTPIRVNPTRGKD